MLYRIVYIYENLFVFFSKSWVCLGIQGHTPSAAPAELLSVKHLRRGGGIRRAGLPAGRRVRAEGAWERMARASSRRRRGRSFAKRRQARRRGVLRRGAQRPPRRGAQQGPSQRGARRRGTRRRGGAHTNRKDTELMGSAFLPPGRSDIATRIDNRDGWLSCWMPIFLVFLSLLANPLV